MPIHLTAEPLDLRLARPFRISRGVQDTARSLLVEVEHEGLTGIGEAAPDGGGYYGETRETMLAAVPQLADALPADPFHIEDAIAALDRALHHGNGALKSAVDMAVYDLVGKRLGVPAWRLFGLDAARAPLTSFTIGIDRPQAMAEQAAAAARTYPVLKIKVGTPNDIETVRAIRDVTDATLRVDANAAWTPKEAVRSIEALAPFGIELVEQPVPAGDVEGLRFVRERVSVPVFADESCVTVDDVPRMVGAVDGINIKLAKCGGLLNALKMIHTARAHHLRVMFGCMVCSSLAITAAAHLSPLVDYADLDGGLLLANDPFEGVRVEQGRLVLPDTPGLGVRRRDATTGTLEQ